jgi:hypothetical protein
LANDPVAKIRRSTAELGVVSEVRYIPNLANPIDAEVLRKNPPDVDRQLGVPLRPLRQSIRIAFPAGVFVPG